MTGFGWPVNNPCPFSGLTAIFHDYSVLQAFSDGKCDPPPIDAVGEDVDFTCADIRRMLKLARLSRYVMIK
jgi:hypothetical protein